MLSLVARAGTSCRALARRSPQTIGAAGERFLAEAAEAGLDGRWLQGEFVR